MARILIRLPNWLGDAVMAAGAIEAFAQAHPYHSLSLTGLPSSLSLFEAAPYIDERIPFDRKGRHAGLAGTVKLAGELSRRKFDTAVLLTNSFSSSLIFYLASIPKRIGYAGQYKTWMLTHPLSPPPTGTHQAMKYARLLMDSPPSSLSPKIELLDGEIQHIKHNYADILTGGNPRIGMAPGAAYGSAKRWPATRYIELARLCREELQATVLLFGSKEEAPMVHSIQHGAGEGVINLAGKTTLRELYALLRACHVVVSNDSGAMHAAAAVGTPVIGLFGPTSYQETGPLGESVAIISKDLDCAPCFERTCPLKNQDCMNQIFADEVFEEVKKKLNA